MQAKTNSEQRAREYLKRHPRPDIGALGGDRSKKVPKLLGKVSSPAIAEVFPDFDFFEFEHPLFSGRPDPRMILAVHKDGSIKELKFFVDFGVDGSAADFFARHCAVSSKSSRRVVQAYSDFLGDRGGPQIAASFDRDGHLVEIKAAPPEPR